MPPGRAASRALPLPKSFTLVSVGPGIYAAIARKGSRASVGNAGFVIGTSGVLVVDTFASPAAAQELAGEIRRRTRVPVRWVVNTHSHSDHVGGNAVFARAGARILAREDSRKRARTETSKGSGEITPGDREDRAALAPPDMTDSSAISLWLGDRRVDVFARPGHSEEDSVVVVRDANVLFAGDLLEKNTIPDLVNADIEAWADTLKGFIRDFPAATFVPGHGEVGRALDVRFFRDYLSGLRLSVAKGIAEGKSGRALVAGLLPLHRERFGSWKRFGELAEKNIERAEAEIRGTKTPLPTPRPRPSSALPGGR